MNKVYIVIVTYNAMNWLEKCLASINFKQYNVVIIDNGSHDETIDFIKHNYANQVKLFINSENIGFGAANNIGIKSAYENGADFVFLLNQDAYLQEETLSELIEVSKKNPEYGILSPMHLNGKGDALDFNFSNYITPEKCKDFCSDAILENYKKEIYELPFVNAAAWLLTKKCIQTVGGFNPSFFHYGEDDNYCQRVLFHNLKIGIIPNAFVYHDREERKKNIYFKDVIIIKKRKIILDYSNPNFINYKPKYKIEFIKKVIKTIIGFQFNKISNLIKEYNLYQTIPFNQIIENREKSKNKGLIFLE